MTKIISIKKPIEPNEELIKCLEELLDESKSGKLRTFVCVTQDHDHEMFQIACVDHKANLYSIMGALQHLNQRILLDVHRTSEEIQYDEDPA